MNLKVLLSVFITLLFKISVSQPILDYVNNGFIVGQTFSVSFCPYFSAGLPGANQTWNFSNIQSTSTSIIVVKPTPANVVIPVINAVNITLFDSLNNKSQFYSLFNDSLKSVISNEFASACAQPQMSLKYPFNYGDSIKKGFTCNNGPNSGGPQSYLVKYDGYGTLILPNATYNNVVRIKYISSMTQYTGFGTQAFQGKIYDTTYCWFSLGIHYPIAKLKANYFIKNTSPSIITKHFTYVNAISIGLLENKANSSTLSVFPNPADDKINIMYDYNLKAGNYMVVNALGETVKQGLFSIESSETIDVSSLNSGYYILLIDINGKKDTKKFVICR
jgi:hypothetical protein